MAEATAKQAPDVLPTYRADGRCVCVAGATQGVAIPHPVAACESTTMAEVIANALNDAMAKLRKE